MKTLLIVVLCASWSWACPKGSTEYEGNCVVDIKPETGPSVVPSAERPPKDKMPSYQREGIKVIELPSLISADAKQDREWNDADMAGKKAAGIR